MDFLLGVDRVGTKTIDVMQAANESDSDVNGLLIKMRDEYAKGESGLFHEINFVKTHPINIVFSRLVFTKAKNSIVIEVIKRELRKHQPEYSFRYSILKRLPVAGALSWAMSNDGYKNFLAIVRYLYNDLEPEPCQGVIS